MLCNRVAELTKHLLSVSLEAYNDVQKIHTHNIFVTLGIVQSLLHKAQVAHNDAFDIKNPYFIFIWFIQQGAYRFLHVQPGCFAPVVIDIDKSPFTYLFSLL